MTVKSLDDLKKIKSERLKERSKYKKRVLVGLSSCGIAAGAKLVFEEISKQLKDKGNTDVEVVRAGCVGYCYTEPTIEIKTDSGSLLLGPVKLEDVANVVDMHILHDIKESKYVLQKTFKSCME